MRRGAFYENHHCGRGQGGLGPDQHTCPVENKVTIIDQNPQLVDNIINIYDVMGVCGNGASYDVQKEADVDKATLLIATASSDEINIFDVPGGRSWAFPIPSPDPEPGYEKQLRFMREELGAVHGHQSGEGHRPGDRPGAAVPRGHEAGVLLQGTAGAGGSTAWQENSALHGTQLSDLYRNIRVRVLICAVSRRDETYIPSGDFCSAGGDKIYLTAAPHELELFFRHLGVFRGRASSVMIVGASKMCYYLALPNSSTWACP